MDRRRIFRMVSAALFLALAYVLPFLTGQIPEIGSMLCPMHIPVLLCGFVCGPWWGAAVGLIVPLFRSVTMGMPPLFPTAVCMAAELAVYGFAAGWLHRLLPARRVFLYVSLLSAMVLGRLVWGGATLLAVGVRGFGLSAFFAGAVLNALPGIVLQILLIPVIVMVLQRLPAVKQCMGRDKR